MRLPAWMGARLWLACPAGILRASLGASSRRHAERTAQALAATCGAILAQAKAALESIDMDNPSDMNDDKRALAEQVVSACQGVIAEALAQPARAAGLSRKLGSAQATLLMVQAEVDKGPAGLASVRDNADALVRDALKSLLVHAKEPLTAAQALRVVPGLVAADAPVASANASPDAPHTADGPVATTAPVDERPGRSALMEGAAGRMPLFSEVSVAYITMRQKADGDNHPDIKYLRLRRQTFIDLIGDKPVTDYYPSDLQDYVSAMQYWPANATKRAQMRNMTTHEILAANRDLHLAPLSRKTMKEGYVANIRTMFRHGMQNHRYRDPLAGARTKYSQTLTPSKVREGLDAAVLNKVFAEGVASGELLKAMLPLLAMFTSRRLALLLFLQGGDIRKKHGVNIAQSDGIVEVDGRFVRVPAKTDDSMTFFVLQRLLDEIGFVDWAARQEGWIFAAPHEHPDPAKYVSQAMNRHLRRCGAKGDNSEVFHSLRGDGITQIRDTAVRDRGVRLQAGHELADVHEAYGFKALTAKECRELAGRPLPDGIDWSVFHGLDFDRLAAGRPTRGRRPKPKS